MERLEKLVTLKSQGVGGTTVTAIPHCYQCLKRAVQGPFFLLQERCRWLSSMRVSLMRVGITLWFSRGP